MKVPPLNLNPDASRAGMSLPFSPDLLWRYPLSLQHSPLAPPTSPLLDVKNQMPAQLPVDPRLWTRDDVPTFLRWFEREFELPKIDSTKFCMNGKALCMLTKTDLAERAPGAGDVLHNTLQFLLRDAPQVPPSPITPHHPLLSPSAPTSQPWSLVSSSELHTLGHLLQQGGSVTLSPAPSEQSGGSPRHPDSSAAPGAYPHSSSSASTGSTHSGSHSDSEDSTGDASPQRSPLPPQSYGSPFSAQALASLKHLTDYQRAAAAAAAAAAVAAHSHEDAPTQAPTHHTKLSQSGLYTQQGPQQAATPPQQHQPSQHPSPAFGGDEPVETGTNGRLLWDFLQQLLNDTQQRYSRYISWKNRDTGVFKIVDPPGLARLWGIQKNHLSMNYDKMSRALRYYYRVNILRKVQGERHCYQFLRNPSELKSIKNISLLRGAPVPSPRKWDPAPLPPPIAATPMEEEGPTDLSMAASAQILHIQDRDVHPSQPENLSVGDREDIKTETFGPEVYE